MPDDQRELPPLDRAAFASRYGPRALVAGGANGIGAEYCRQIAATGLDLMVLDRDESGLHAVQLYIEETVAFRVNTPEAAVHLAYPAGPSSGSKRGK